MIRELNSLKTFLNQYDLADLFLATVIKTEGSTYRKQGAKKLIHSSGKSAGMLSGGCLENEIIQTALSSSKDVFMQSFDTNGEIDRLMGYGVGCKGVTHILFESFRFVRSKTEALQFYLGEGSFCHGKNIVCIDSSSPMFGKRYSLDTKNNIIFSQSDDFTNIKSLQRFIDPWPQNIDLKIFGIGHDVEVLYEFIQTLNWQVEFFDYRRDQVSLREQQNWPVKAWQAEEEELPFEVHERTAVLLLSHNYPYELEILQKIDFEKLPYIGLLGPKQKREQMLEDLVSYNKAFPKDALENCFYAPIGIGGLGKGEEAIAVSVIAQLQQKFFNL